MTNTTDVETYNSSPKCLFNQLEPGYLLKKRYRIQQELGEGNSSKVFLAIDTKLGALPVAIKAYHPSFISSPNFNKSYIYELQNSLKVNHENVIKFYDMIKSEEFIALVSEYVDGITLEQMSINWDSKLVPAQVKEILMQTIRGLETIHSQKIAHCDIRPKNIMINTNGMIKIMNLGTTLQSRATENDFKHDLRSIGIISYELITGVPYTCTANIIEHSPSCPENLAKIIERLITADSEVAYFEAKKARLDLERIDLRSTGLPFAPTIIKVEKKPSFFETLQNASKEQAKVVTQSIVQTILDIPKAIFLTPFNVLRHAFGSSVIIYPIVAIALYYFVKRKDIISRILSSITN